MQATAAINERHCWMNFLVLASVKFMHIACSYQLLWPPEVAPKHIRNEELQTLTPIFITLPTFCSKEQKIATLTFSNSKVFCFSQTQCSLSNNRRERWYWKDFVHFVLYKWSFFQNPSLITFYFHSRYISPAKSN